MTGQRGERLAAANAVVMMAALMTAVGLAMGFKAKAALADAGPIRCRSVAVEISGLAGPRQHEVEAAIAGDPELNLIVVPDAADLRLRTRVILRAQKVAESPLVIGQICATTTIQVGDAASAALTDGAICLHPQKARPTAAWTQQEARALWPQLIRRIVKELRGFVAESTCAAGSSQGTALAHAASAAPGGSAVGPAGANVVPGPYAASATGTARPASGGAAAARIDQPAPTHLDRAWAGRTAGSAGALGIAAAGFGLWVWWRRRIRTGRVFISYRRTDRNLVNSLQIHLDHLLGAGTVFQDLSSMEPGEEFARSLQVALDRAKIVLAVIGPDWLDRLHDKQHRGQPDVLLDELLGARRRNLRMIPLLVGGAELPARDALPEPLQFLVGLHAYTLPDTGNPRDNAATFARYLRSPGRARRKPRAATVPYQE